MDYNNIPSSNTQYEGYDATLSMLGDLDIPTDETETAVFGSEGELFLASAIDGGISLMAAPVNPGTITSGNITKNTQVINNDVYYGSVNGVQYGIYSRLLVGGTGLGVLQGQSGGYAYNVLVKAGGELVVANGNGSGDRWGEVSNVTVESGGFLSAIKYGHVFNATILAGGSMLVSNTTHDTNSANNIVLLVSNVNVYGVMRISGRSDKDRRPGVYDVKINYGGRVVVGEYGRLYDSFVFSGGVLSANESAYVSSAVIYKGGQFFISGTSNILSKSVALAEYTHISSGGIAVASTYSEVNFTHIHTGGTFTINPNADVRNTQIFIGGREIISSGASSVQATIYSGASQSVGYGAYTLGADILYGGKAVIHSGGRGDYSNLDGLQMRINAGGTLQVSGGGYANVVHQYVGGALVLSAYSGQTGVMISGYHANSTIAWGSATTAQTFRVSNGVASNVHLYAGGSLYVYSGGSAQNITLHQGGVLTLNVMEGDAINTAGNVSASVTSQEVGGVLKIAYTGGDGTNLTGSNVSGAFSINNAQRIASGLILYDGAYLKITNAQARNTAVSSGGAQHVSAGASAVGNSIYLGGSQNLYSGGAASNTTLNSGGRVSATAGATVGGSNYWAGTVLLNGAVDASGGAITFGVNQRSVADGVIVNNIANLTNASTYSVSVNNGQSGKYALAGGAAAFNYTVNLIVNGVATGQTMTVNGAGQIYNDVSYGLVVDADTLYLNAVPKEDPSMIVTIADGNVIDAYDHEISLAEAMTVYANHGGSLGTVVGFANTATSVALGSSIQQSIANMVISGNGATATTVSAASNIRIIVGPGNTLTASALTLNGVSVGSGGLFNADNSVLFSGGTANNGGAIYNSGSANISGGSFTGNSAIVGGGAIYNVGKLEINDVTFGGNFASSGGAINNSGIGGTVNISGAVFSGNAASSVNGAIANSNGLVNISDTIFAFNSAVTQGEGGAIGNYFGIVNISGGEFSSNSASYTGGAALNTSGTMTISNVSFTGNSATVAGGAFYNYGGTTTITSATFIANSGRVGGAVYGVADLIISDTVFSGNLGDSRGGALYYNGSKMDITGGSFVSNVVKSSGGGIVNIGTATITSVVFSGNTGNSGGGIFNASSVTISGGSFVSNYAIGGAIYNSNRATITDVVFSGNSGKQSGGAIFNSGSASINGGTFSVNSTANAGGAIANFKSVEISEVAFVGNSAGSGGAIVNAMSNATISNGNFDGNKARFGGALYNAVSGTVIIDGGTFVGNTTASQGGAIYNSGIATVNNGIFSANSATAAGGAIYNNGTMNLSNASFLTKTDTILNGGSLSLRGTITLHATLSTTQAVDADGALIVLALENRTNADGVLINNHALVNGDANYAVTVDSSQLGLYKLAGTATAFDTEVSLFVDGVDSGITLTVGANYQTYGANGYGYKLVLDSGTLSLSVVQKETPSLIVTISDGDLIDPYDNEISLAEAMSIYASGGSLGAVIGFANTVTSVIFSSSIIPAISNMILSGNGDTVISSVSGGQIIVSNWDNLYVEQGTIVGGILLESGAELHVLDGGVVSNISAGKDWAGVLISSGGSAVSTLICNNNASQRVYSGGTALYTTLSASYEDVSGGHAVSTVIFDSARQDVYDGDLAEYTSVNSGGAQYVTSQGVANYAIINFGGVQEILDATVNNTTVNSGGSQGVYSATANDTTVNSGGDVVAYDDAVFGGATYWAGAVVLSGSVSATGTITFGVNQRTEADGVIIDNIANLTNNGTYAVSVTDSQDGKYALAGGAAAFNDSISLVVGGVDTGLVLTVGGPAQKYNDIEYAITVDGDILYLNIFTFNPIIVTILGDAHIDGENTYRECVEIYASQGYDEVNFKDTLNGGTVMITSGAVNAGAQTLIRGNGITSTYVGGAATYGNGYGLEMNDLTYLNNLAGGSFNASIDGGASLTLDTVTVTNTGTAYATAGSVVSGRLKQYYIDGDVDFNIINTTFASLSRTAGAGFVDTANLVVTGDVNIDVKDSKLVILYGGAWLVNGGLVRIKGDINITLDLGTQSGGAIYAGSYVPGSGTSIIEGTTSMTIKSGNFTGVVGNGSYVTAGNEASQGDSVLTIEGGNFTRAVYAGGYSNGGISVVNGNTYLNISGGTFATNVYGGSYGNNATNGDKTLINGSTNITIDCSVNAISFGRYIQAGSAGNGVIIGDTNITFTGLGSNLTFAAGAAVSGESEVARTTNNYVSGDKHINFDNFTGDFNALLVGFTNFTIKGDSQVSYIGGVDSDKLSYVNSWGFALTDNNKADGALIWDGGINNFSGDSIELAFDSSLLGTGETAKIIDGNAASVITGWDAFGAVNFVIGGVNYAANWSAGDAGYLSSNGWLLSADESNFDLILTKIS